MERALQEQFISQVPSSEQIPTEDTFYDEMIWEEEDELSLEKRKTGKTTRRNGISPELSMVVPTSKKSYNLCFRNCGMRKEYQRSGVIM